MEGLLIDYRFRFQFHCNSNKEGLLKEVQELANMPGSVLYCSAQGAHFWFVWNPGENLIWETVNTHLVQVCTYIVLYKYLRVSMCLYMTLVFIQSICVYIYNIYSHTGLYVCIIYVHIYQCIQIYAYI